MAILENRFDRNSLRFISLHSHWIVSIYIWLLFGRDINWRWWVKEGRKTTRKKEMLDDGRCSVKTTWKWIINTFNGYFVDLFNAQRPLPMAKTGQYRAGRWAKLDGMLRLRAPTISLSFKELLWALLLECIMADRIRLIECVVLMRSFNCFQFEWWIAVWRINRTKCAMNKKIKEEIMMDAFRNVPVQLIISFSLLYLRNQCVHIIYIQWNERVTAAAIITSLRRWTTNKHHNLFA